MSNPVDDVAKLRKEFEEILKLLNLINDASGSFADNVSGKGKGKSKGGGAKRGSNAGGVSSSLGLGDISVPAGSLPPPIAPPSPPWARDAAGSGGVTAGSAAVRVGTAVAGGIAGFMPDTNSMVDMQQSLFQASYATGGHMGPGDFDRLSNISKAAFGNMQTSVGSAQRSAAIVSQFGFDPYGAAGRRMLGQVGAISLTTGMSNEQVAGTLASQSTNSVMTNRMRMLGFEMFDSQGNPKDVAQVAHHILKVTYGTNPTPKQIQMGLRPGGALDLMIQSYIPDPGMQEIVKDNMRKQALNQGQYTANDAATANRLGLNNNFLNPRVTGMRYQSSESNKADAMRNSAVTGYGYGVDAASSLNEAFTNLAENVMIVSTLLQTAAGIQGGMSGFFGTGPGQAVSGAIGALSSGPGGGVTGMVLKKIMGMFFADGGVIKGPGGPKDDKVPALLSNGEFVVQASAVDKYGVDLFEKLNAKRFAEGGLNSPSEAVSWALAHTGQDLGYEGLCDHFVAQAYGRDHSGYASAREHYQAALAAKDIHTDQNPPPGALVYWDTGANGHIALSVGGGKVASTDFLHKGQEDVVPIADITEKWGTYLGWSDPFYDGKVQATLGPSTSTAQTGTGTVGTSSTSTTTGSSAPSITGTKPLYQGANLTTGVSGLSGKYQGILAAIDNGPVWAVIGKSSETTNSTPTSSSTQNTTTSTSVPSGNPTYQGTDDGNGPIDISKIIDNPANNRSWAQSMAASRGWTGAEWDALDFVWQHESGFHIKSSDGAQGGATDGNWGTPKTWGIPQSNPGHKMKEAGPDWRTNALTQIKWGLDYISSAYGTPSKAKQHGMETGHPGSNDGYGWYSKGAWQVEKDQIAHIHQNEMILPAPAAEAVRTVMRENRAGQTGSSSKAGGSGVVINLTVARASDDEAVRVARKVKRMIEDDQLISAIGNGHG